jgi:hypothetical protein
MNAPHGDASARPVGNYLHGCNSSELISQRSPCRLSPAQSLIEALRVGDQRMVGRILSRPDLPRVAIELAQSVIGPKSLRPHGTHAAFNRHKNAGEAPCPDCVTAEREYQRGRMRRRRESDRQLALLPTAAPNPGVDPIAVERFVTGDETVHLTRAEKRAAYQAFLARDVSHNQAAERLGLSGATARKVAAELEQRSAAS